MRDIDTSRIEWDKLNPILLLKPDHCAPKPIEYLLNELIGQRPTEVVKAVGLLEIRMRTQGKSASLVVLSVPDKAIMDQLLDIAELFSDVPLLAIVPEGDPVILAMAHRLRPRYVCNHEDEPGDIVSVLKNIMGERNTFCSVEHVL